MKTELDQSQISRRFHVSFRIRGNPESMQYDCFFDNGIDFDRSPKSAEAALLEFHRYMQKQRRLPWESYTVTGLFSTYTDAQRLPVRSDYALTETRNPDLLSKKPEPVETVAMFDEDEIKNASLHAKVKTRALV